MARLWRREGLNVPQKRPKAGAVVAHGGVVDPPPGRLPPPGVGVRLCERADTRWPAFEDSDGRG